MKGIEKQMKTQRYVEFGKFILNYYQLENNNILLIKYPKSLAPITKLRRTIISDNLKIFLKDLINFQIINIDLQKEISTEEIKILENLLNLSGLTQHLKYKRIDRTIQDAVHRFEVLKGGLLAGNQSIELKEELSKILKLFINKQIIDSKEGYELIEILA
jgi:hypothetical protein